MSENLEVVREFVAAWSRLDVAELVAYFADDGVYHNMPIDPVKGRVALAGFINAFLAGWTKTDWEILNIVEHGNVVMVERVDRTELGGKQVALPCCGVFEMEAGKIKVWRDYFDMATYRRALEG